MTANTVTGPWVLELPGPDAKIMGSNHDHRAHYLAVARHRKTARTTAALAAHYARIPPMERATVEVAIYLKAWKRADPGNYPGGSTIKGMIDGLVDAGVIPDDKQAHLALRMPTLHPISGPGLLIPYVRLTIHPWPAEAAG